MPRGSAGTESLGLVHVTRRPLGSTFTGRVLVTPPSHLRRLDLTFDFSAEGVYQLLDSQSLPTTEEACTSSTSTSEDGGCYFTLNSLDVLDLHSAATDRPLQPMFVYDSRLSGTSYHGFLRKGGTYEQIDNWLPIFAELQPNVDGDFSNRGSLPRDAVDNGAGPVREDDTDDNVDARRLKGVDQGFASTSCATGPAGDDVVIALASVAVWVESS